MVLAAVGIYGDNICSSREDIVDEELDPSNFADLRLILWASSILLLEAHQVVVLILVEIDIDEASLLHHSTSALEQLLHTQIGHDLEISLSESLFFALEVFSG